MGELSRQERRRLERERSGKLAKAAPKAHTIIGGQIINLRECMLKLKLCHPQSPSGGKIVTRSITAVVDTGATNSAVTQGIVDALGLPVIGRTRIGTANGTKEVDVVAARAILPCHEDATKVFSKLVQLSVVDMVGEMLFGMDLLEGGVLTVNMCAGTWEWKLLNAHDPDGHETPAVELR